MSEPIVQMPSFAPGTAEWHEQRRRAVGGSEVAALLGIGKWESRFSLWHRKAGVISAQEDNPQMEWGRRLEPVILAKYAEEHPDRPVASSGTFTRTDRPWQIASPDAVAGPGRIVEVKTARDDRDDQWGEPGSDEIPVYYRAQCIWYLDVLGVRECDVAVLIGGSEYREYTVGYAADEAAFMREQAVEFIASLEAGERPGIDEHQATYQAIRELHPEIDPVDIELPVELATAYCRARVDSDEAKAELQQQTSLVADFMGTARRATCLGRPIATRQARGDGTPYVVAARNLPGFLKREAS